MPARGSANIHSLQNGYVVTLYPPAAEFEAPRGRSNPVTAEYSFVFVSIEPALAAMKKFMENPKIDPDELVVHH